MTQQLAADRELLSALIDGELDAPEAGSMLTACRQRSQLTDDWSVYHCIGDVLRSEDMGCHSGALAGKMAARLALEPHLLALPQPTETGYSSRWRRPASLAAAAAAVATVAWLALPQLRSTQDQVAAAPAMPPALSAAVPASSSLPPPRVANGYVEAHRQFSSSVAGHRGGGMVQSINFDGGR